MLEVIGGVIGIIAALVGYWLHKKRSKPTEEDLLRSIHKAKADRTAQEARDLRSLSAGDYSRLRDLDLLLSKKRDRPAE